jgi:hypothetical protein
LQWIIRSRGQKSSIPEQDSAQGLLGPSYCLICPVETRSAELGQGNWTPNFSPVICGNKSYVDGTMLSWSLAEEVGEITEIDLNPIFAFQPTKGCIIADARISVR